MILEGWLSARVITHPRLSLRCSQTPANPHCLGTSLKDPVGHHLPPRESRTHRALPWARRGTPCPEPSFPSPPLVFQVSAQIWGALSRPPGGESPCPCCYTVRLPARARVRVCVCVCDHTRMCSVLVYRGRCNRVSQQQKCLFTQSDIKAPPGRAPSAGSGEGPPCLVQLPGLRGSWAGGCSPPTSAPVVTWLLPVCARPPAAPLMRTSCCIHSPPGQSRVVTPTCFT